jgi:leader peptidase (prepilin peptidase)/N-methyltransferase
LFLLTFFILKTFNFELILYWAIWSLLIAIFVYDLKHKIIPDGLVYIFIILSLIKLFFFPGLSIFPDLLTGLIIAAFFALLWLLSKGQWMGFGDAKLSLGIGFLMGFRYAPSSIILAFWIGAAISLLLILIRKLSLFNSNSRLPQAIKNLTIKSEIPLAPFLIIGAILVFFLKLDVLNLTTKLFI